jgi:hypothetical protein
MSKIAPPNRRSTDFQTHLERHFTPGRFAEIGYTAGLEIYAAKTKSVVYPNTVISRTCKTRKSQS